MNTARVTSIVPTGAKPWVGPNGTMYDFRVSLSDNTVGVAKTKSQVAPPYAVGDMVEYEITGNYNGESKLKITKPKGAAPAQAPANSEPVQGQKFRTPEGQLPIHGATVGHAMTHALDKLTMGLTHDEVVARLVTKNFWLSVREVASDIIRVAQGLEQGNLAKTITERLGGPAPARPATPPPSPPPAKGDTGPDEDVPF